MSTLLAFGAHPDDVESGVGGLLVKAREGGHDVVIATGLPSMELVEGAQEERMLPSSICRLAESRAAASIIGARPDDLKMLCTYDIAIAVRECFECIRRHKPDIVLVNAKEDAHPTHRVLAHAVADAVFLAQTDSATRTGTPHRVSGLGYYRTFSTVSFDPNCFIEVTEQLPTLMRALECHQTGLEELPALRHWAKSQRLESGCRYGVAFAESLRFEFESTLTYKASRVRLMQILLSLEGHGEPCCKARSL